MIQIKAPNKWPAGKYEIDWDQLERFSEPVFGVVKDLENTHTGNVAGHHQRLFDEKETEPKDIYSLIDAPWKKF